MTGKFYTFGHHEENARPHKMMFYVWYSNKEKFYTTFDVTDQVHKAPDRKHVHIIIDNADGHSLRDDQTYRTYRSFSNSRGEVPSRREL